MELHAGHYDLKTNALVEMVSEIRGGHRQDLVPGDDNYDEVNRIQVGKFCCTVLSSSSSSYPPLQSPLLPSPFSGG